MSRKTRGKAADFESRRNLTYERDEGGKTRTAGEKLDCLKLNRQWSKTGPMGKRLKPIPTSAKVVNPDLCNRARCGRWLMKSLKLLNELSKPC